MFTTKSMLEANNVRLHLTYKITRPKRNRKGRKKLFEIHKKKKTKKQQPQQKSISYTGINHRHTTEKYDGLAEKKSANSITSGLFIHKNECGTFVCLSLSLSPSIFLFLSLCLSFSLTHLFTLNLYV